MKVLLEANFLTQIKSLNIIKSQYFGWFCKKSGSITNGKQSLLETIENRHSKRNFLKKEVEDSKLKQLINYVNMAPSAGNIQGYQVKIVRNKDIKKQLAESAISQQWIKGAAGILVFCARKDLSQAKFRERGRDLFALQDATIACAYAQLCLQELGLAGCWVGGFYEDKVSKVLNLDQTKARPIAMLPFGYSEDKAANKKRRKVEDVFEFID
eukprot:TRINITY_DN3333_c0_g1_i2.p1 TRINITY_DN3333_c0_g1~~TRINITY_DN3333_c0_g1_i2.p1  ORF type:complete len:212 (+),score=43.26 TRINITY_DN3333_c0_g1_i2:117-752(+)